MLGEGGSIDAGAPEAGAQDADLQPPSKKAHIDAAGHITFKTIADMYPETTMSGGIIAVEADQYREVRGYVPVDFNLKNEAPYFFLRFLWDTNLFIIMDGPFKNWVCAGITENGRNLAEYREWENWLSFNKTGKGPQTKYLFLAFARMHLTSENIIELRGCDDAVHRVGESKRIPNRSYAGTGGHIYLDDYVSKLHEIVANPAIELLSRLSYRSITYTERERTFIHASMEWKETADRDGADMLVLDWEIHNMVSDSRQEYRTQILDRFLATKVQKQIITEQWMGRINQLRALLLRCTRDILVVQESNDETRNGIFGFSKIIIEHDHRGVENLTKFDERVCDMVLANVNRVWDIYSDANWWDAPHASAQVKALLDYYNYFPSSWPEYTEALKDLQSQPSTQYSQVLSFRWLFKPRRP